MSGKTDFQIPLEPERYELTAAAAYCFEVDRREFFKFLGAGILIVAVLKTRMHSRNPVPVSGLTIPSPRKSELGSTLERTAR